MSALRANTEAVTAADAPVRLERKGRLRRQPFRIVAPDTPHRAALQKDSSADTGAVVYAEPLDVEDNAANNFCAWFKHDQIPFA